MGFLLIKGKFFIVGYQPDGDSVKFMPNNVQLLKKITTEDHKPANVKVNAKGHTQLRIEGIDALETHYVAGGTLHQPLGDATAARKHLLTILGFTGVTFGPSDIEVTGTNNDGMQGYILTKFVDNNRFGRPVSFVFAGTTNIQDGNDKVFLDATLVKKSVNYQMLFDGFAYPTFYSNFYSDLRKAFTDATNKAQSAHRGLWPKDVSTKGFSVNNIKSITDNAVIFPKLFRRLAEHINKNKKPLSTFKQFLEEKNDELFVLNEFHKKNLNNLVKISGKKVTLLEEPENIIFVPQG
jgi:endonuclease YncB( thermonuclease family)